jgi:hypothetical protein
MTENLTTYYTLKWAERNGLNKKYAKEALKMITELSLETDYDADVIEAVVLSKYPLNPPESILDKFKEKENKIDGELVTFTRY